ncbi:MAG: integration host factor subunit alpha [Desulfobacterales bacterium]|uniref:Integration host factor subunit alpha n=1 Tax=Candidatus Desulfatibia vada TaxID=2841696 RepID=A0A8J6TJI2_9BACT|nr:integration host factor subunit alpha [Candidatus Desulfatibia vada]
MTLTKSQIVEKINTSTNSSRNKSSDTIETLLEIIKQTLASGEDVLVSGFGKFCVKEKSERRGRNPSTGGDMMLAPRKVVTFRCSGKLRDRVNR